MELIFNEKYCNSLLNIMADHIYETQNFIFFGKKMSKTYHNAQKMAKYYIKCAQLNVAIYTIVNTPYLENYIQSLQLLDQYGYVHYNDDFNEMTEPMELVNVYASKFTELDSVIKKYKQEVQSMKLTKISFKEINLMCVRVKHSIKEFNQKREHLFNQCVQILETLIEQHKLEKIINKIKELEAKKILK